MEIWIFYGCCGCYGRLFRLVDDCGGKLIETDWNKKFVHWMTNLQKNKNMKSVISSFTSCLNGLAPLARTVADFANPNQKHIQLFPSFLAKSKTNSSGVITPYASILFCGLFIFGLGLLPFDFLVQYYLIIRVVNVWLEYGALIKLKWSHKYTQRPFAIPGGMMVAILISIPTLAISLFTVYYSSYQSWIYGGGSLTLILIAYFVRYLYLRYRHKLHKSKGFSVQWRDRSHIILLQNLLKCVDIFLLIRWL